MTCVADISHKTPRMVASSRSFRLKSLCHAVTMVTDNNATSSGNWGMFSNDSMIKDNTTVLAIHLAAIMPFQTNDFSVCCCNPTKVS